MRAEATAGMRPGVEPRRCCAASGELQGEHRSDKTMPVRAASMHNAIGLGDERLCG